MKMSSEQAISFREYMELCLYHPDYGYYCSDKEKVGKKGDFYTSTSIGGLFGEVLAQYMAGQARINGSIKRLTCVEWGGGNGGLAKQLLDELKLNYSDVYERIHYISVEISPHHQSLQATSLLEHEAAGRVRWMSEEQWLAGGPWTDTIVFSNEFVDALPVHRIQMLKDEPMEIWVEWEETKACFQEKLVAIHAESPLRKYLQHIPVQLHHRQRLEINLEALHWISRIGHALGNGQLLSIDYGDCAEEIVAEHRMNGTLMCYQNHTAADNPYAAPGLQDLTAHVNFTALAEAGLDVGLEAEILLTQKQFLVSNGLLDKLQNTSSTDPFSPAARRNRAVRQLLLSDQMSELFKVLVQKKGEPL
ncbi:SAM-dependent methyltransferase [Paenibacillus sp. S3N08]|uniref:SAM-dependent methyltransferase n=2 Tax=Paenibacillus agricola TaxID=2716264 RepID=A0ABX0J686_9BACL|nr:SAM-dependent methyltransferase [Paenibacillus agricola]